MNDQITTLAALKRRPTTSMSALPLGRPLPAEATSASRAVDVFSFLFLIVFQCVAVIALVLYTPQIGEMGLIVFSIIFVWLGATVTIGACDLWATSQKPAAECR
jgi:hypothetical protein